MAGKGEKEEKEKDEAEAPPAKKSKKLLWVLLLLVLPAIAAGATYFLVSGGSSSRSESKKATKPVRRPAGPTLALETFIVNLHDPGGNRYLKTTIELEMASAPSEETKLFLPRLRDQILLYLSSLKLEDALKRETKQAIKNKVLELATGIMGKGMVSAVYFKEFVMQ